MHPIKLLFLVALALLELGEARVYWEEWAHKIRLDKRVRPLLPEVLLSAEVNLTHSGNCSRDLATYRNAIARRDDWAVKMLDSSSKMPTGLMQGHLVEIGMFDECQSIINNELSGRHCMYSFSLGIVENALPFDPKLSICIPNSCTADDIARLVNKAILTSDELKGLRAKVGNINCASLKPKPIDARLIIFLFLSGSYIAFIGFCTFSDIIKLRSAIEPQLLQTLKRFSILKSAKAIFSLKTHQDDLPVIHGIRVLSNLGILIFHVILTKSIDLNINVFSLQKLYSQWLSLIPLVCLYCVDTFFALSGFLAAYGFFKKTQQEQHSGILGYYLRRYIRLSFPMLILTFSVIELTPYLGSGPLFDLVTTIFTKGCPSKWYSHFFYAHNIIKKDDLFLLHFWSLAVDMQLFWISPLIFYPLHKNRKIGLFILTTFLISSVISTAAIVWINNYPAIYVDPELAITRTIKSMINNYVTTYTRASPWFIGAFFGYEVVKKNITPNKTLLSIGWGLTFGGFVSILWGHRIFTNARYEYNVVLEVIFAAFSRPVWAFGVCWIIYASVHNFGGYISTILSSKLFLPLSRLSYCIYLTHVVLLIVKLALTRSPSYVHEQFLIFSCINFVPIAIVIGFCFSILFEMPMFVLNDLIFQKQTKSFSTCKKSKLNFITRITFYVN